MDETYHSNEICYRFHDLRRKEAIREHISQFVNPCLELMLAHEKRGGLSTRIFDVMRFVNYDNLVIQVYVKL